MNPPQRTITVLFLNENPLPEQFTNLTVAAKELRLRSALDKVAQVHVVARRGESLVLPGKGKQTSLEQKIKVHLIACPYYLSPVALLWAGWRWGCRHGRPDVIEAESPVLSGLAALILGRIWSRPVVLEVRSSFDHLLDYKFGWLPAGMRQWFWQRIYPILIRAANLIIANSDFYARQAVGQGARLVAVVNPGLQFLPTDFRASKPDILQHPSSVRLGFLGRLAPEKGADVVIRAFAQLCHCLPDYDLQLLVGGKGKEESVLRRLVQELGLEQQVQLLGWVNNWQFLSQIDVLVNATLVSPPLEMVNVEAARSGVPVVAVGDSQRPETVLVGETGLKVDLQPQDDLVRRLSETICRLISRPEQLDRMGRRARQWAARQYGFERQVDRLRRAYSELGLWN